MTIGNDLQWGSGCAMSKLNFTEVYSVVDTAVKNLDYDVSVACLSDDLIKLTLDTYFRNDLDGHDYDNVFTAHNVMDKVLRDYLTDKVVAFTETILDKNEYGRGYDLAWRYKRGTLEIPYFDVGPSTTLLRSCKARYSVDISELANVIRAEMIDISRISRKDHMYLAQRFFEYHAKLYFHGFAKEEGEEYHPLSSFFSKEELIIYLNDVDEDENLENPDDVSLVDLILDTFAELEVSTYNIFCTLMLPMGLDENSIVHLYPTDLEGRVRVLVEHDDVKTKFFNVAYDYKRATVKDGIDGSQFDFCKSRL